MKPIIRVRNLSKKYTLGALEAPYVTIRETLSGFFRAPLKQFRQNKESAGMIWALNDVNFDIAPSEVVGIIGRNGAGKSTLLKILSRITEPTKGEVDLYGRVASLLEVGTGFHPELTGRENIFLNGSILGMKRTEIQSKFDEIVAFSEVEKFLDTPVKRYSSGMYVRLAFAVAAHLEPEILVVDEVLAVGDAAFQKKCIGKMSDVARHGRTVLFVSHNMVAIKSLCNRALLIEQGRIALDNEVDEVVNSYLRAGTDDSARTGIIPDDAPRLYRTDEARLRRVRITDDSGNDSSQAYLGQPFQVHMTFEVFKEITDAVIEVGAVAMDGVRVTHSSTIDGGKPPLILPVGWHTFTLRMRAVLMPQQYTVLVGLHHLNGITVEWIERALDFTVLRVAETGSDNYRWYNVRGYIRPPADWLLDGIQTAGGAPTTDSADEDLVVGGEECLQKKY